MRPLRATPGWLTVIAVAAVAAVNLAGLWGIRVARQGALDEARSRFATDVKSRALLLEARLSGVQSDLTLTADASFIERLDAPGPDPATASVLRQAADSSLLVFLRSHPELVRIVVWSEDNRPLAHVGRRGGVPVLWVSASPTGHEGAAIDPRRPRLTTRVPQGEAARARSGTVSIETEVDPASLLDLWGRTENGPHCLLRDDAGRVLGRERGPHEQRGGVPALTESWPVAAEGWSVPGPLHLDCVLPEGATLGASEPVWTRYRTTSALNLAVMALGLLLGGFALQQARRRARLEAQAGEEARVRELERQLFHAERLTTVGRLAAGIAHEINNPLEGMKNYLTLARDALARGDALAASRHVAATKQGLDRAAGIVRQVLAHADPAKAPRTPVDLNQLLRETLGFVRSRKEFRHVAFDLQLAEGELLVHGNPVMLGQVAMNLIVNACEVQPDRGEVRVVSRRVEGRVEAEFADRGPGIPAADRQRIFEPFYSTKDSTGLGLSICHTIVRQHDGELEVGPREGGGSVFRLRLPALAGPALSAEATTEARSR
ncbi:MAG TPA: ATP-binding protein [Vicinamibacteria bacterium]|nr:ATP-binding protein [Vicinamibacteria bacterium]